jgi:hypothetical protein
MNSLDRSFLNLAPMGLKSEMFTVINDLIKAVELQDVYIKDLQEQVYQLKKANRPVSAARAKRGV